MKKLTFLLSALILAGCGIQHYPISSKQISQVKQLRVFNHQRQSLTAKTAFPLALKEINKTAPQAQLYEVDYWQEQEGNTLDFGFIKQGNDEVFSTIRVSFELSTGKITVQESTKGGKVPNPVDAQHWQLDNPKVFALAQKNGLRDQEYLATLWEDTWHISGLSQHLYFQMDSMSGAIKLRCTGPYLDHCTGADGEPVTPWQDGQDRVFRNYLKTRK